MPPDVVPSYNTRELEWVEVEEKINNMVVRIPFINHKLVQIDLNIEYSRYENFINFSSAEKRLKNFKYKISQLDGYIQESSSLVSVTNSENDLLSYDNKIRLLKSNFDGYESYLYNISSSYKSSSMGEFPDASWPKTGSGS